MEIKVNIDDKCLVIDLEHETIQLDGVFKYYYFDEVDNDAGYFMDESNPEVFKLALSKAKKLRVFI